MRNQTAIDAAKSRTLFVYGYSSDKNPFYKEARGKQLDADHWSLLLKAPVSHGQKLLLIGAAGQIPVQGEIVTMRAVADRMFEVAVALTR